MWAEPSWRGTLWPRGVPANRALRQYASVFNTVEGNTSFYSLPSPDSVSRWTELTPPGFRFCFKVPRDISHEARLEAADRLMDDFLDRVEPLGARLGPIMVQLPGSFGPARLPVLDRFLERLAGSCALAVELRHRAFYDDQAVAGETREMLLAHDCERVVIDTRALRAGDPGHPSVLAARHQKPDLPVVPDALTDHPVYRWVGHPEPDVNEPWLEELARLAVTWIQEGRQPYLMVHCPDTAQTPWMARRLHGAVARVAAVAGIDAGELPPFPFERAAAEGDQLGLFD